MSSRDSDSDSNTFSQFRSIGHNSSGANSDGTEKKQSTRKQANTRASRLSVLNSPDNNIECANCEEKFHDKTGFIAHVENAHRQMACEECLNVFTKTRDIRHHIAIFHHIGVWCNICWRCVGDLELTCEAKETQDGHRMKLKTAQLLDRVNTSPLAPTETNPDNPFSVFVGLFRCTLCRESAEKVYTIAELTAHMKKQHNKGTGFVVEDSAKVFRPATSDEIQLAESKVKPTRKNSPNRFFCLSCKSRHSTKDSAIQHMFDVHHLGPCELMCLQCNHSYNTRKDVVRHLKSVKHKSNKRGLLKIRL